MSWWAVGALCGGAYLLKLLGFVLADRVSAARVADGSLTLLVVPVLAALILIGTFDGGGRLTLDARAGALAVAAVLVWRRAPLLLVVLAAGATAALLRLA